MRDQPEFGNQESRVLNILQSLWLIIILDVTFLSEIHIVADNNSVTRRLNPSPLPQI